MTDKSAVECPECMPKHRADLAQSEEWRDENGVCAEGYLFPSRAYSLLYCNTCGIYFERVGDKMLRVPHSQLCNYHRDKPYVNAS